MRRPLWSVSVVVLSVSLVLLVTPLVLRQVPWEGDREEEEMEGVEELPPALARRLAAMATFAPAAAGSLGEDAGGTGLQDWIEHATPGPDIPFAALAGARGLIAGAHF